MDWMTRIHSIPGRTGFFPLSESPDRLDSTQTHIQWVLTFFSSGKVAGA